MVSVKPRIKNSACQRTESSVILDSRKKYIKRLCSSGKPQPQKAAELPEAKMEAGEIPARSRHCKGGAFFETTEEKFGMQPEAKTLGREKCADARVRRHAQMRDLFTATCECSGLFLW